jgi:hypothetical protein
MISIKNVQFTRVKSAISTLCPNSGTVEDSESPPAFPYLLFVQKDNPIYRESQTFDSKENHVQPMIQIVAYTSKDNDTMYHCEQIFNAADTQMIADGWTRIFGPEPSTKGYNSLTARYQAIVQQNAPNDFTVI